MEQITIILLALTIFAAILKTSFFKNNFQTLFFGLICGIIVFSFFPFAIQQNKMILQNLLSDKNILQNISAILIVEKLVFIGINIYQLQKFHGEIPKIKPILQKTIGIFSFFPGFIFFTSLFYFEVQVFLLGIQLNFSIIAFLFAFSIFLAIIFGNIFIKKIWKSIDLRLEMSYFLHFLQIILAIVIVSNSEQTKQFNSLNNNFENVFGVGLIMFGLSFLGFIIYKIQANIYKNRRNKIQK